MANHWQCIQSPASTVLRHAAKVVSMSQFSLSVATRGEFRIQVDDLPLIFDSVNSTESVAVFTASSENFVINLRFYLQSAMSLHVKFTPLTRRAALVEWISLAMEKVMVGPHGRRMRVFKHGYQSWSETRSFGVDEREVRPLLHWLDVLQANPRNRASNKRGEFTSESYTLIRNQEHDVVLLAGQQSPFKQYVNFRSTFNPKSLARNQFQLQWRWDFGGQRLPLGQTKELDPLLFFVGQDVNELLETYLQTLKPANIKKQSLPSGWCSWYYYYTKVTGKDIEENASCAAVHKIDWQFFVLDDGYQNAIGDWLVENEKFSCGLAHIARTIKEMGMHPGIWTAPFITMKKSKLTQEHPDWLLRQAYKDKPVLAGWNPGWGGNFFALDITHPGVQDYLRTVFSTFTKEYGFRFLKLDFVYAASLTGRPYNPAYSSAERLTLGYQIIREAAGEDTFILGCGSPISSAIGYVDAMRIGADVAPYWFDWKRAILTRDSNALSTKVAIRSILNRAQQHRNLWINDPDCLMLRDTETKLNPDERFSLINAAIITAGMGVFSDRLEALPEKIWQDIARIRELTLACDKGKAYVLDFMEREMPEIVYNTAGYLAVFNFDDAPKQKVLDLKGRLGDALPHGAKLVDVWQQVRLTVEGKQLVLRSMPPHSSRLFKIEK
ncbi:MAG: alpha-galactosidase [Anaerolineaceae bacterium]|nr:alpha-galactosidase [Anaerolineaceae bacterium]